MFSTTNLTTQNQGEQLNKRYCKIYRKLRWAIATLQYQPGTLLSENILAKKFGISRTPIRRVLNELEQHKFVETKAGSGTRVTSLDYYNFDDLYQLRIALIKLMRELSPLPTKPKHIEEIQEIIIKIEASSKDMMSLVAITAELYEFCLQFIGNRPLRDICEFLYYHSLRFHLTLFDSSPEEYYSKQLEELLNLKQVLLDGNTQALFAFRQAYLEMSYFDLKRNYKS